MSLYIASINRLAKWRSVFVGWQLGTRLRGDPEAEAVRSSVEGQLIMRAEVTAISGMLFKKGICTQQEYEAQVAVEAQNLMHLLEKKFPGARATDDGMSFDVAKWTETTKGWKP